jgi:hypothetical protein
MKLTIVFLVFTSYNLFSQVILTTTPKYYNYQNESVAMQWNTVVNYDIKNTKTYNGCTENTQFKTFDSLSRVTLERFILDRFNHYRKLRGATPLVWDEDLRALCYQHVTYQRLAGIQTHFQNEKNVPNFEELGIGTRHRKLCTDSPKFKNSSEGLINQAFQIKGARCPDLIYPTYKMIVDLFFTLKFGYNTCELHWNDIMDAQWDSVFIYYDFNFVNANPTDWAYSNVTIVFASYEK